MAIPPPSSDDLAGIAGQYGIRLSPGDLESFRGLVTGALGSYDAVQRLYEARLPEPPDRPYQWPAAVGNERRILLSELSGQSSILAKTTKYDITHDKELTVKILNQVQDLDLSLAQARRAGAA